MQLPATATASSVATATDEGRRASKRRRMDDNGTGSVETGRQRSARTSKASEQDDSPSDAASDEVAKRANDGAQQARKADSSPPSSLRGRYYTPLMEPLTKASFDQYKVKELKDAEIFYKPSWIDEQTANRWREEIDELSQWYRPTLKVYGREVIQSRHIAAFATEPTLKLKYSGTQVDMHSPFPPLIQEIADRLSSEDCLGEAVGFNHCMLNRYENGNIYIGKHSDNLENKVIVTVSLGAPRTFILERKKPRASKSSSKDARAKAAQNFFQPRNTEKEVDGDAPSQAAVTQKKLVLANGSLLVMQGDTQKNYTHEIPKERKVTEPRISLTFRQLVY